MDIKYRKSKIKDLPLILDILGRVSGNTEDISAEQFLIAKDGSKIIGCVRIKNKDNGIPDIPNLEYP